MVGRVEGEVSAVTVVAVVVGAVGGDVPGEGEEGLVSIADKASIGRAVGADATGA
jgi:hypothetical protein